MFTIPRTIRICCISLGLLVFCCLLSPDIRAVTPEEQEDSIELGSISIIRYKVNGDFKVRGWKLSPQVYFGNAKVNGKWGVGLLVDKGTYVFGLNNSQATILIRY
jgi:hypothetical protein